MNAILNINVRVAASQAQQGLRTIQQQVAQLNKQMASGAASSFSMFHPRAMERFGKNLQWTGRQLEFNFTLPLLLAGGAATKWALDSEKAMVQVQKVYGDGTESAAQLRGELDALGVSFDLMSSRFGVHKDAVIDIAGAWAQAGSAGAGLARSVKLTLQTMILGQLDAEKAAQGLIGIQSAYSLSTQELTAVIADLNVVENQTGITMAELIDVLTRAGGTAKTAGIEIRELTALAAALVPAAGSGAQAGNALRTIISRIMAPTKEASDLLGLMGINIKEAAWQSQDAMGRIETLADSFMDLSDAQKTVVSSAIASRWQLNRFDLMMEQVAGNTGFFQRALNATNEEWRKAHGITKSVADVMQNELLVALQSQPQQFAMLWNVLRNTLTQAVQPLIPHLIMLAKSIVKMVTAFTKLNPETQQFIVLLLGVLALVGPLARYVGAFALLFSTMGKAVMWATTQLIGHRVAVATDAAAQAASIPITEAATISYVRQGGALAFLRNSFARLFTLLVDVGVAALWAMAGALDTLVAAMVVSVARIATVMRVLLTTVSRGVIMIVGRTFAGIVAMLSGITAPVWAIIAAIAAVVVVGLALIENLYDGGIRGLIEDIGSGLRRLPGIVASAFSAVVRVIASAMTQVIEWLSYLNPFQRHSPSLVENVTNGIGVILGQYARLRGIPAILASAITALDRFNAAAAGGRESLADKEFGESRAAIQVIAPEALPATDELYASLKLLRPELEAIGDEVASQELVVKKWEIALDAANLALDEQEATLRSLRVTAEAAQDVLAAATTEMDRLRDIKPTGWYAMQDAIFANEEAQKRLRLEILRLEDAGQSVADLESKMASLRGEIEKLRGDRESLRQAGAGSDILGSFDQQISELQGMEDAIIEAGSPIKDLQDQLDDLQRQGEILDLESWLNFAPWQRQIDAVGQSMEEMPMDTLKASIEAQQNEVDRLTKVWKDAEAAVKAQDTAVDAARTARDELQQSYTNEKNTLDALNESYRTTEGLIRDMEQALNDFATAAKKAADEKSQAEALFAAGEGFNFDDIGGITGIGREGDLFDIEAFNKQMEDELNKALENIGANLDPFAPIKTKFKEAWQWVKDNAVRLALGALAGLAAGLALGAGGWALAIVVALGAGLNALLGGRIWEAMQVAWTWVTEQLWPWLIDLFKPLGELLSDILKPIGEAFAALWNDVLLPVLKVMADVFGIIFNAIGTALRFLWERVLRPVFQALGGFITSYVVPVLQLIAAVAEIVFTMVGRLVMWLWESIMQPVSGFIVDVIGNVLVPMFQLFQALVTIALTAVGGVIMWLWQQVVSPALNQIGGAFTWVWENIIRPVLGAIADFIEQRVAPVFWWLVHNVISPLMNAAASIISSIWGGITDAIKNSANFFIRAFNTIAKGVKSIANFLHIQVRIDEMPEIGSGGGGGGGGGSSRFMHSGGWVEGTMGGPGLKQDEQRAILQKGEYVLSRDQVKKMRRDGDIDIFHEGGIVGALSNPFGTLVDEARKNAVKAIAQPYLLMADAIIGQIPHEVFRGGAIQTKNMFYDWAKGGGGLAEGGHIMRRGRFLVGEGGEPEVVDIPRGGRVVPLSRYNEARVEKTYNFYGDLEFPNIKNGDDAEAFVRNLETLANG